MAYFEKFPIPSKNCKNPSSWPNIAPPIVELIIMTMPREKIVVQRPGTAV